MEEYSKDLSQIILNNKAKLYQFKEANKTLLVRSSIGTLTITGSNNTVVIESSVPCLIIIGHHNVINSTYFKNSLCNLIIHGSNNEIYLSSDSSFINQLNTGMNNAITLSSFKCGMTDAYADNCKEETHRQHIISEMIEFRMKDYEQYAKRPEITCAICIKSFEDNDLLKLFPCNEHVYHKDCLLAWTKISNLCPLCKFNMKTRL